MNAKTTLVDSDNSESIHEELLPVVCDITSDDVPGIINELKENGADYDDYQIETMVYSGPIAKVFKAYHMELNRTMALKVISHQVTNKLEVLAHFLQEAFLASQLEHSNILAVNDIGVLKDGRIFYSMPYITGEKLEDILKKIAVRDPRHLEKCNLLTLLKLFRQVCDACAFAHKKGVVHRSIRPATIMVRNWDRALVISWGMAATTEQIHMGNSPSAFTKLLDDREEFLTTQSVYLSPEQALGMNQKIDSRTDIFLLGATLYTIATLCEPYSGDSFEEITKKARKGEFTPPDEKAPEREIPKGICQIIDRAMQFLPEKRYQSVEELRCDVDTWIKKNETSAQRFFPSGSLLMEEGDVGSEAYLILDGQVDVYRNLGGTKVDLRKLSKGDIVGELALISSAPRSASVVAMTDTNVRVISNDLLTKETDKLSKWMSRIIQSLVNYSRQLEDNPNGMNARDCSYKVISQIRLLYPILGKPDYDSENKKQSLLIVTDDLIHEIKLNLSISAARIQSVITRLQEWGMMKACSDNRLEIPNYPIFYRFVEFVACKHGMENATRGDRTPILFASEIETVMSLTDTPRVESESELQEIIPDVLKELPINYSHEELNTQFESLYSTIFDLPSPTLPPKLTTDTDISPSSETS